MALAQRPAEEQAGTGAEPQRGRSLWDDAWARLKANRAAVASAALLALMLLACVVGPWLSPHPFDAVYRSYVKVPASLAPYPRAEQIGPSLESALRRARVSVEDWREEGGRVFVTVTSGRAIDPRTTRYLDRANDFSDTRVEETSEDGKRMVFSAEVERLYFLFGTDANGRDLLTRTLIAGRISLTIGLLATLVALFIGVTWAGGSTR